MPERSTARLAYLDFLRGVAVLIMIESHAFHAFERLDLRQDSAYLLSQFVGGLAAPLFLFIAGIMVGFRIEKRDEEGRRAGERLLDTLRRGGYIFLIAELMLLQQWIFQWRFAAWRHLMRADILNCMALAICVSSVIALLPRQRRPGGALAFGALIAALAPVASAFDWSGAPTIVRDYLIASPGRFAFFPEAAYVPFGMAVGFAIRRAGQQHSETAMKWMALAGLGLIYAGEFGANQPYTLYAHSSFWLNSPCLIAIRTGIMTLGVPVAFLWNRFGVASAFAVQMGKTSLLVYWVHVELIYGSWLHALKRQMTDSESAIAALAVIALMYVLSVTKTRYWPGVRGAFTTKVMSREGSGPLAASNASPLTPAR